ncbi:MAG TPA: efflux RND transporter periplasmic adaptor subunit [Candidatus Acidoferrum sp.]|nr:efflux RND transporter periplasmic adaptor subunit [Candidatus Acidoferrum sp.]
MTAEGKKSRWNKRTMSIAAAAAIGVVVIGGFRLASSKTNIPTGEAKKKEFVDYLEIKGEVKAERSVIITAPYSAGDLQILTIVANSAKVKKGDTLVEFDATTVKSKLAQDKSALTSADAEIQQARAAAKLKEEQDLTDVMKAKFDTEKAKMDASKQEILSVIEGEQAKLKLADAEQKWKEADAKLKADRASAGSDLASRKQKYDQAAYQVQLDEKSLASLTLRAPLDGVVALQNHWEPQGGPTPFKQGDRAWPGAGLMELPDATALKISARIEEAERGQLNVGQTAKLQFDALPDRSFEGKVKTISPTASLDFTAGWPIPRNFSVELSLSELDPRLTPGMGAQVRVAVARVPDGIVIPARALFRKAGRTVVYEKHGSKFEERDVEVSRKSGDEVLVAKGIQPGAMLALKDPTLEQ